MDVITSVLQPLLAMFGAKFGIIGTIGAYGLAAVPVVTVLIELLQFIVTMTASKSDDAFAAKLVDAWEKKVLPVLEILPHANLPISATMVKIIDIVVRVTSAAKGAISGWMNPPAPPSGPSTPSGS